MRHFGGVRRFPRLRRRVINGPRVWRPHMHVHEHAAAKVKRATGITKRLFS
ncbi:hypothetical protein GBF38_005379, partial [Nibea albiflora]